MQNLQKLFKSGASSPIVDKYTPFLEEIALESRIAPTFFDARDLATVVYRTMRDLMSNEASASVASELHDEIEEDVANKRLQDEISDLWKDDNPIVCLV